MRVPIRLPGKSKSKYRAVRTDGYASKREAARGAKLELLQAAGAIRGLQKQVKYVLIPKDEMGREISYWADFVYIVGKSDVVVEDAKGFKTPVYKLKKRLMWTVWKIAIQEV